MTYSVNELIQKPCLSSLAECMIKEKPASAGFYILNENFSNYFQIYMISLYSSVYRQLLILKLVHP